MKIFTKITISLVILMILATSVYAQQNRFGADQIAKVRQELERTDQLIRQAQEYLNQNNSPKAQLAYETAVKIQDKAWEYFNQDTYVGYREALFLTRQAIDKAKYAYVNGSYSEQNDDIIQRKIEMTRELYLRVKNETSFTNNQRIRTILDLADDNLQKAFEFYRNGQNRPALKLCNQVEASLKKIINVANRYQFNQANYEKNEEMVQQALENAGEIISECASEKAAQLYAQAQNNFEMAQQFAHQEKPAAALKALQKAFNHINQALRLCNGNQFLEGRIEKIKTEADQIAETNDLNDETAQKLLEQVYLQLDLAKEFLEKEQLDMAAASVRAAAISLRQLKNLL